VGVSWVSTGLGLTAYVVRLTMAREEPSRRAVPGRGIQDRPELVYQLPAKGLYFPHYAAALGTTFRGLGVSAFIEIIEVVAQG
jgi:hypothetical protein